MVDFVVMHGPGGIRRQAERLTIDDILSLIDEHPTRDPVGLLRQVKVTLHVGALRELVALPPGLASSHALGVHLWCLTRPRAGHLDKDGELVGVSQPAKSVRMVDGSAFDRERLREVEGSWWHQFREEPGVTASVPVIDLLDDDVDLTPSRYIQHAEVDVAAEHRQALDELAPLLKALPDSLPGAFPSVGAAAMGPTVSVAELIRVDAVDLILNRDTPRVSCRLQPGDVLVSVLDAAEPPLVVTDQRGEPTPDRHLLVTRTYSTRTSWPGSCAAKPIPARP